MRIIQNDDLNVSSNLTEALLKLPSEGEAYNLIVDLLVRNIYSNPIGACVRELVSNAIDANVQVDKEFIPIEVSLSLNDNVHNNNLYELSIRDYGEGIKPEKMQKVIEIGFSDKREGINANKFIGAFGIGLKSLFNVTEQGFIKSYVAGGKGYEYIAYKNKKGFRGISLLKEFVFNEEPLGTDIKLLIDASIVKALSTEISINCCWFQPFIKTNISQLIHNINLVKELPRLDLGNNVLLIYTPLNYYNDLGIVSQLCNYSIYSTTNTNVVLNGLSLIIGGVPYYGVWDSNTLRTYIFNYISNKSKGKLEANFALMEFIFEVPVDINIHLNSNRESIQMTDTSKETIENLLIKALDYLWEKETSIGKDITDIWEGIKVIGTWALTYKRLLKGHILLERLGIYLNTDSYGGSFLSNTIPILLDITNYFNKYYYFSGNPKLISKDVQTLLGNQFSDIKESIICERLTNITVLPTISLKEIPLVISNTKSPNKVRKALNWDLDKPFILNWIKDVNLLNQYKESSTIKLLNIRVVIFDVRKTSILSNSKLEEKEVQSLNKQQLNSLLQIGFLTSWTKSSFDNNLQSITLSKLPEEYLIYSTCNRQRNDYEYWYSELISSALYTCSLINPQNTYVITPSAKEKLLTLNLNLIRIEDYLFKSFIIPLREYDEELCGWLIHDFVNAQSSYSNHSYWIKTNSLVIKLLIVINALIPECLTNKAKGLIEMFKGGFGNKKLKELEIELLVKCLCVGSFSLNNNYITPRKELKEIKVGNWKKEALPTFLNPKHKLYELLCNLNIGILNEDKLHRIILSAIS